MRQVRDKALTHPAVTILAHSTGRLITHREPCAIDLEEFNAANNVTVELNAQSDRLDLNDLHLFRAREIGVKIAVNTDGHSIEQLRFMRYGIDQARLARKAPCLERHDTAPVRKLARAAATAQ